MRRAAAALRAVGVAAVGFDLLLVLVVVAVDAEQFPVAAIVRVVVVVVVAVVHRQFAQVGGGEFAGAAAADPRVDFQGALAVTLGAAVGGLAGIADDLVEAAVVDGFHAVVSIGLGWILTRRPARPVLVTGGRSP